MTDYLEEHLGNAEALLERIRQLEQSASGLSPGTDPEENVHNIDNFDQKPQAIEAKTETVSEKTTEVYHMEKEVGLIDKIVDEPEIGPEIHETGRDMAVNRRIKADDDSRDPGRTEEASQGEETQTSAERAENRAPLSAQLEELDRAVSALTALSPEGRETAQNSWSADGRAESYPVSLPGPQALTAGPNITGATGGDWIGPGTVARADSAYDGTQAWAEQADRMFRRDSRRYDGGFYLY